MAASLIAAEDVTVDFGGGPILDRVDVRVEEGEAVTVIGPNGAGKTTLVRVLLGLLPPTAGRVRRAKGVSVGYMPQRLHVDPIMPLTVRRFLSLAKGVDQTGIEAVLNEVGAAETADKPLRAISGGETQRVLLARALLRRPRLLVLDEPAQGVDVGGQSALYDLIGRIKADRGCGVLMVSHDLHLVMAATDRVICLNRHVCCDGHPSAVSEAPEYKALFGADAGALAVYRHDHDHAHAPDGSCVTEDGGEDVR